MFWFSLLHYFTDHEIDSLPPFPHLNSVYWLFAHCRLTQEPGSPLRGVAGASGGSLSPIRSYRVSEIRHVYCAHFLGQCDQLGEEDETDVN